jgi:hypothetical protein
MQSRVVATVLMTAWALFCVAPVSAQNSKSVALAKELTTILDSAKLDSMAARELGSEDGFVAALYYPGSQLLVIAATYSAPALMKEKIILKQYKDVYLDLNSATSPASRRVIEDLKADGLYATRTSSNEPFDFYTKGTSPRVKFDGEWKKQKITQDDYMKVFTEADAEYTQMLQALLAEAKGGK